MICSAAKASARSTFCRWTSRAASRPLAGFDIERFRPELVLIEARGDNQPVLMDYFTRHGYERIDAYFERDPLNWYFRPR